MILYPDPIYNTIENIISDCIEADTDGYQCIKLELFHSIMWQYNVEGSGFIQKKDSDPQDQKTEFEEIYQMLAVKYKEEDEFYYNKLDDVGIPMIRNDIINFKAHRLSKGLVDNDRKTLERFLMEYFEGLDEEKKGTLTSE